MHGDRTISGRGTPRLSDDVGTVQSRIIDLSPSFVGRLHERAALAHHLDMLDAGLRIVTVAGEPGIGKSRLLSWASEQALERGAMVLRGGASQAVGMPPYLPILEALGQYIRSADPDVLHEEVGTGKEPLSAIVPELQIRLRDVPPGYPLPPEQARLRLFEAVGAFLTMISARIPLVLLLDDLQWADGSTLDLVCHVTRTQPEARILIAAAYRDTELDENAALQRTIAELSRQRHLTTLTVGPLSLEETGALAANHLIGPVDSELCGVLHNQSEGNPFFAEELLRGWLELGGLARRGKGWSFSAASQPELPPTIVGAVRQRVERLPPETVDRLRVAAVTGRTFQLSLIATVTKEDIETVERSLGAARTARLIRPEGNGRYSFVHDTIRECLYADVSDVRRQRLHERIGQALEESDGGRVSSRFADLAFHFARSGALERGISYSMHAAEEALRRSALQEAVEQYQTAQDLMDRSDERRGSISLALAEATLMAGHEADAAEAFEEARGLLLAAGDRLGAAKAAHGLGVARLRRDAHLEARIAFEASLDLLSDHTGPESVKVLVDLASLLSVSLGMQDEGIARGEQALELARRLDAKQVEASAHRAVGNLKVRGNDIPTGIGLLERALALAQAVDDPAEAAECCACLANAYYWTADIDRSRAYTLLREEFARRCQQPYQLRHVYSWLAFLAATQGDWNEAEDMLTRARSVVEGLLSDEPLAFLHQIQGFLAWQRGNFSLAEDELTRAVAIFRRHGPSNLVWYLGPLGLARLACGKQDGALECLAEVEALVSSLPPGILPTAPALVCMTMMAARLGNRSLASRYQAQLMAFDGQLHWFPVAPALAEAEALCGDLAASAHLDEAERAARRSGMQPALEPIQHLRVRLRADGTGRHPRPAGLSGREVDVLRLVAGGLSNREIAKELYLSENTVAKHLTSIFNKTGSENRAAAAAFAMRHGLSV